MNDGLGTTTTETGTSSSLIDSDHVQGTSVFDTGGKNIGTIKRLVIDKVSGRVAYTVAQFGGFLGLGGEGVYDPLEHADVRHELGWLPHERHRGPAARRAGL